MAQVWHIRTVGGVEMPMPKSLEFDEYTIDLDSYRSASGLLIRNPLPTKKHKFFLTYPPMDKTTIQALLTILDSESFTVSYENMITGVLTSGLFYCGDKKIKPIIIKSEDNTDVLHDVFSINLIEY